MRGEGNLILLFLKKLIMKFELISNITDYSSIYQLWNEEYGYIFPITEELFVRNLENAFDDASLVAIEDEKIVGFIIGKIWQEDFIVPSYDKYAWISLMFVAKKYRNRGIGSALLNKVESIFIREGKSLINLGKDCHTYFPGLPVDLKAFLPWFEKRGYIYTHSSFDLIRRDKNLLPIMNPNYVFRTARISDKENLIAFMDRIWPGRWKEEMVEYFNCGGDGSEYLIGLNNKEEICAFAKVTNPETKEKLISYSLTWRKRFERLGGIGPLGVDPNYRGLNLGYDLVASAVNYLNTNYHVSDIIIDWTGLLEFYRHMGFEVWKSYYDLEKKLKD